MVGENLYFGAEYSVYLLQLFLEAGRYVKDFFLSASNVVASGESVGIVVICITAAFFVCAFRYVWENNQKKRAVGALYIEVAKADTRSEFAERFVDFESELSTDRKKSPVNSYDWQIRRAWEEYSETLVIPDDEMVDSPVRNTVRPNFFFNSHDLGFEHGMWRHVPGIFVSFGLLLTFLGIIAAINALRTFDDQAMQIFLDAAKSKFIMSLSGLFASILFTILYRSQSAILERNISRLCDAIEFRVLFHTPEQIAAEQLKEIQEQTALLKVLGNDLGAQIGDAVSATLTRDLAPVLDKVGSSAGTEVSGMVGQIGDALNAKLNDSLDEMSRTLSTINRTLVDVTDRLTSSGNSIGEEMSKGVENLNAVIETARRQYEADQEAAHKAREKDLEVSQAAISTLLESIESNTRDNNAKLNEAALNIAKAAESLTGAITDAGNRVTAKASSAVADIGVEVNRKVTDAGADITGKLASISGEFLANIAEFQSTLDASLVEPIRTMASRLEASNRELEKHAAAINQANASHEKSTESITNSTKSLESVSRPLADSVERAERINNAIRNSLEGSLKMMEASRAAVDQSMSAMQSSISQFRDIVANAEDLDEKLGAAFDEISSGLNVSQDQIRRFSEEVTTRFGDGIQSIQTVLDGISEFEPSEQ